MIASKQMDPEALDHLRYFVEQNRSSIALDFVAALLADRDYQEQRAIGAERDRGSVERDRDSAAEGLAASRRLLAGARSEIARLRARVRVEADDVERVGVTMVHVEAWATARKGYILDEIAAMEVSPDPSQTTRPDGGVV